MNRYAVLLRGVNVGGVRMTMPALKEALDTLPVSDVRTLLASGNVVCRYDGPAEELKSLVEGRLREAFGYDAWVVVLSGHRLAELVDACPYPADSADRQTYLTLSSSPRVLDELAGAVAEADPDAQETRLGPDAVAWTCPVGATLSSPRAVLSAKARYKPHITDRNLRTLIKIRDAVAALPE